MKCAVVSHVAVVTHGSIGDLTVFCVGRKNGDVDAGHFLRDFSERFLGHLSFSIGRGATAGFNPCSLEVRNWLAVGATTSDYAAHCSRTVNVTIRNKDGANKPLPTLQHHLGMAQELDRNRM